MSTTSRKPRKRKRRKYASAAEVDRAMRRMESRLAITEAENERLRREMFVERAK